MVTGPNHERIRGGIILCRCLQPFNHGCFLQCVDTPRCKPQPNIVLSRSNSEPVSLLIAGHSHHGHPRSVEVTYLASRVCLSCWYLDCSSIFSMTREVRRTGLQQQQTRIPNIPLSARQSARGQNSLPEGNWTTSRESLMSKTGTGLTEYGTWSRMAVRGLRTRGEQSSMWACSETGK